MADIKKSAAQLIGRTPLLEASNYAESQGIMDVVLLAKLEYLNPAGSVKDRVALSMIEDAEKRPLSNRLPAIRVSVWPQWLRPRDTRRYLLSLRL